MKKKRMALFRWLCMMLTLCVLLTNSAMSVFAANRTTVKVGIFSLGEFQDWNDHNNACGYNVDYLNKIAEITHWDYEYVPCKNWVDATEKLENKEIDLLAPAQITDALSEKFDYATLYMGTEAAAIYTKAENQALSYENFEAMNDLVYGCAENSTFAKKFVSEYCPAHDLSPEIKYYANTTELQAALQSGAVDAIVTNIMFASDSYKLLGWFSPLPVYYITQNGNQDLLQELDNAMMKIMVESPDFTAELESQYFPIFSNIEFSYEEMQYMQSLPAIKIGYTVNQEPVSAADDAGEFTGITRDMLERIQEITGLTFEYVPLPATKVTSDYLQEQGIYMISDVEYNPYNLSLSSMHMTMPYLDADKVLVADENLAFNADSRLKIALATGSGTFAKVIQSEYPNFEIAVYDTVDECFTAVRKGDADGTIQNRYVADCSLENPLYSDLSVIPIRISSSQLCLAVMEYAGDTSALGSQMNNSMLISVLDKAIQQITTEEMNDAIITNTANYRYSYTLLDFLRKYWIQMVAAVVAVLICIVLLLHAQQTEATKNRELAKKNQQLADAVSAADEANTAKSRFLSRMSHEIRTPMNAIVGLTTLAKQHKYEPDKIQDYLVKVESASRVLLNIINDVLDMSAIESQKMKIADTEFDLKQVLSAITSIYYTQCKNKGISFRMMTDITDEMVIGDPLRVNQILLNLVSNAYKFTDDGGEISILVTQKEQRREQVFVRFQIMDTGCGMSPEMLERLFRPFEQESADTARKHGGSGLGLSIAKNLVDMMHGAIRVESELGKGTTFIVDLPFGSTGHTVQIDGEKLRDLKALVVDDDKNARLYTGVVLERVGISYDMAESGEEAMELIRKQHNNGREYDLCFLDWKMPGMDGVALTKEIRKRYDKETAVVIVSAYDLNEVEDEAKAAGADVFITKPLFQSTVFNLLMQVTNGSIQKPIAESDAFDFTGKCVLLAEDNEMNTEIATEILEMVHMKVDHAVNGKRAVEMFLEAPVGTYDLILMDIQMPEMDGYAATRAIRASAHPDAREIPIYAMTANAFTEDVSSALSAGMNGHIAKPIDTSVLYHTIDTALKN